jgi:hypothetical protein
MRDTNTVCRRQHLRQDEFPIPIIARVPSTQ